MDEEFSNLLLKLFAKAAFNTKTSAEWEVSSYQASKGELLFSLDMIDPEDPLTWIIKAKFGVGCKTWNELPYWSTDPNAQYRPVKILTQADFTDGEYINGDWAGLTHYQVMYNGSRLKEQITKNLSGGFSLNDGFQLYEGEVMVIF